MKKITIGIFNDSFFPMTDGVLMVIDNYAKRLAKFANVIVFVPKYKEDYDDSRFNYKVVRCKSIKTPLYVYALPTPDIDRNFKEELEKSNLDIVHIHSPFTVGKIGLKYAKKHNIPVVATMHSQFRQDFKRFFKNDFIAERFNRSLINLFEKCDECWAVNSEVGRIFHEDYGYSKLPRTMDNATEMLPIKNKKEAISFIKDKHSIKNEKILLFVGRINKLKNIYFIAKALELVKDRLDYKMIFMGTGPDEKDFKEYINNSSIKDKVIFVGNITDRELVAKYFAAADLFLFPSLYDASSIVQIEAASQSLPGLFLKGAATTANVIDNENGFLENNDIKDYADRIVEIFNDKKLLDSVSKRAFEELYVNWDMKIDEVYKLYLDLINKKNSIK